MRLLKANAHSWGPRKRAGEKVTYKDQDGKTKSFRKHKGLPKGCSVPRQICIKCLKKVIHKNDKRYESKVCKDCA